MFCPDDTPPVKEKSFAKSRDKPVMHTVIEFVTHPACFCLLPACTYPQHRNESIQFLHAFHRQIKFLLDR